VLLLATPAVALLIDRMPELSPRWRIATWSLLAIIGLMIFDLVGKRMYSRFMALSIVTLCAVGLVVVLAQLRRLKLA
jgi:hypothetical protein